MNSAGNCWEARLSVRVRTINMQSHGAGAQVHEQGSRFSQQRPDAVFSLSPRGRWLAPKAPTSCRPAPKCSEGCGCRVHGFTAACAGIAEHTPEPSARGSADSTARRFRANANSHRTLHCGGLLQPVHPSGSALAWLIVFPISSTSINSPDDRALALSRRRSR